MRPTNSMICPRTAAVQIILEPRTDLSALRGKSVLAFLDEQNLSIGARDLGFSLDYARLARLFGDSAKGASLHIFVASDGHEHQAVRRLERCGYVVHVKRIREVRYGNGQVRRERNIDNLFSFWVGTLAGGAAYDVVVLGSGDFGLAGELALALSAQAAGTRVMTLSLPGSTAQDLDARKNDAIQANLEIGLDALRPRLPQNRRLSPAWADRQSLLP